MTEMSEEGVVMRVAKLLAIFGIPALLIAASNPLLANDGGGAAAQYVATGHFLPS